MKTCKNPNCPNANPQPLDNFFNDKGFKNGKMAICKTCKQAKTLEWRDKNPRNYNGYMKKWRAANPDKQHATDIKRLYGLSIEDYNKMLMAQNMQCAICPRQHDPSKKRGRLYVDHCHKTGKIRALLCSAHNSMLGYAEDSVEQLQKAIEYLNKHSDKSYGGNMRTLFNNRPVEVVFDRNTDGTRFVKSAYYIDTVEELTDTELDKLQSIIENQ